MSLTNSRKPSFARDEIRLAVHLHQHAHLALQVDVRGHDAFLGSARAFAFGLGDALLAQDRLGFFEVAAGFGQGAFAVHHARVGFVAQGLDELGTNFAHGIGFFGMGLKERVWETKRPSGANRRAVRSSLDLPLNRVGSVN